MKKIITLVLVCALLLTGMSLPAQADVHTVKAANVDELLAGIGSDAVIELDAVDYCLPDAADYGQAGNGIYTWNDCYDGFELIIENVSDLTIRAAEGARLLTAPRYANVLTFRNCRNITIEGLTVGHTPETGACCGGVISLEFCSGVTVDSCVLFGCGVTALIGYDTESVTVRASTLTDCSYSGAELYRCEDVLFDACTFSGNGDAEDYTGSALLLDTCKYVSVMNSAFADNSTDHLLESHASSDVSLLGCSCAGEKLKVGFFYLEATDVTVMNCGFSGLNSGNAFGAAYNQGKLLDMSGNALSLSALLLMKQTPVTERPARTAGIVTPVEGGSKDHYFEVSTADEFLAALGSHRVICVKNDIDLSTASGIGTTWTDNWRWESIYDGAELIIRDVKDLTITAKQPGVSIVTRPRHANVLSFESCRGIAVEGLTVGHTEIPEYECSGAVLVFTDCSDIEIEDCALFGCGTLGVYANTCRDIEIEDTEIFDCTQGGIVFFSVGEAEIEHCSIHDCAEPALYISEDCWDIVAENTLLQPGSYSWQ